MAVELKSGAIPGANDGNKLILASANINTFVVTTPSAGTTAYDLGDIASSDVTQEASKTMKKAEDGKTKKTTFVYDLMTKGVLMQEDKDLLDLLSSGVKNKRYLEVKYNGYINSLYQWYFKFVEVTPAINIHRSGDSSTLNYESTGVFPDSAITISGTTLASIANVLTLSNFPTADVTIPKADGYAIVEV